MVYSQRCLVTWWVPSSFTQRVLVLYPPKWYIHSAVWLPGECQVALHSAFWYSPPKWYIHSAVWLHGECHVALHGAFLYSIHRSGIFTALFGYMASAMWNCCRLGACSLYAVQPRLQALVYDILEEGAGKRCFYTSMHQLTRSLYSKPLYCVFSCNLPPALLAEWPGSFLCYSGNSGGVDTEMWVSTKCLPGDSIFFFFFFKSATLAGNRTRDLWITTERTRVYV